MVPNWNWEIGQDMTWKKPENIPDWNNLQVSGVLQAQSLTHKGFQCALNSSDPSYKYVEYQTEWWGKCINLGDFFGKTEKVTQNPELTSYEIEFDWTKHQLHQQTGELMKTLPTPEELLTKLFGLEESQFMENGRLIMRELIPFFPKQIERIRELLNNQVLSKAGGCYETGKFFKQGEYAYLWTSEAGIVISFDEVGIVLAFMNEHCSFSAVRVKK